MVVQEMYDDFRIQFPELAIVTDARNRDILGGAEQEMPFLWFESLASVMNARMGRSEQHAELAAVFAYFDMRYCTGGKDVRNCIDASFIENLFWEVSPKKVAPVWATLPKNLQQLYVDFHRRPPTME